MRRNLIVFGLGASIGSIISLILGTKPFFSIVLTIVALAIGLYTGDKK